MTTKTMMSLAETMQHAVCKTAALAGLAGLAVMLASAPAQAQELKIGYVNSERVLREATPAKAALARMEADFSKRDKDLNDQAAKLKAAADKLEKDAPTLPESERGRRHRRGGQDRRHTSHAAGRNQRLQCLLDHQNAVPIWNWKR